MRKNARDSTTGNNPTGAIRMAIVTCGLCVALVVFSYWFLDRPLAEFSRAHLQHIAAFIRLTEISEPLRPLALVALVAIGIRLLLGHTLGPVARAVLLTSLALVVASVFTRELKEAFGRTWPQTWVGNNPSYFKDGVYGFNAFHGGPGYASFPSGHMAAMAAAGTVVWHAWQRLRGLAVVACALVAIGLIGANYHWLSDIVAGAFLGGAVGAIVWRFLPAAFLRVDGG